METRTTMHTPKAKRNSGEVPERKSLGTTRTATQLVKAPNLDSPSSISSPNTTSRTPKDRSPKLTDRRSPRSSATEKKKQSRVAEMEQKITHLQEELKKAKDELKESELWREQVQEEGEAAKKSLMAIAEKFEKSQKQLMEQSAAEDDRIQELRKISNERDKAWESELEAVQKQHALDSTALAAAMNEIQKLRNCQETETKALELAGNAQKELEAAKATIEMLRSDMRKAADSYQSLLLNLEQPKLIITGEEDAEDLPIEHEQDDETKMRQQEEDDNIQSSLPIRDAGEEDEHAAVEPESALDVKNKFEDELAELKQCLLDKEMQLQSLADQNELLVTEIHNAKYGKDKENHDVVFVDLIGEAEKSGKRTPWETQQLDAAQAANAEMEVELRRLKVQSNQWRKAAEVAATMLSTENNGKLVGSTSSPDCHYGSLVDDVDDDSPNKKKKKNTNMLQKMGVLWKKNQK